ncbi:MAG: hypothetical protein ABIK42_00565 [candidate division WOR-3 bacterium]
MTANYLERHIPSNAELDAMDRFIRMVKSYRRAGTNSQCCIVKKCKTVRRPSVEQFLKRYPDFAKTLTPVLEGALILDAEFRRFQRKYPDVDLEKLFNVPK